MSRLQNKVALINRRHQPGGIQPARSVQDGAFDRRWRSGGEGLSECPGRPANPTERRTEHDLHGPQIHWRGYFAATEKGAKEAVAELKGRGVASARFAVVSTDPGAFSQNSWIAAMKAQMQAKYPKMQLVDIRYGLGKPAESFSMAQDLINKFRGQLDAIVAPTVVALPKVAEAVEQAGLTGKIVVTGLSTPNDMKEFVKRGTVKTVVLWNPVDLGYVAVYVAQASLMGTLKDNATQAKVPAGRLGTRDAVASLEDITAKGPFTLKNVIVLGNPFRFTKDNIDQFNF